MAHADEIRTDMQQSAKSIDVNNPQSKPEHWKAEQQPGRPQEQSDFAEWLREYRRWTQSGCCAAQRMGEIEWGGEDQDTPKT